MLMSGIKGVILVGGPSLSTSFRPLNLNLPKPLFPIAGEPMVHHHIRALSKVPNMSQILLIGTFEPSLFQSFIEQVEKEFNISIKYQLINFHRYLREYEALGTGGGLYHFRDQILRGSIENIFVLHADVACSFPLQPMLEFHQSHPSALITVMATRVDSEFTSNFGNIIVNDRAEALHYVEKPSTFVSNLISCGVYCFSSAIFKEMKQLREAREEEDNDKIGLERDVLAKLAGSGKMFVFETREFWQQLTSPSSVVPANKGYLDLYAKQGTLAKSDAKCFVGLNSIHPSASIDPSALIGPNVSIGPNCVIGAGVRIKDSIVLASSSIQDNTCILNSIIGWDSRIGTWCRIEGSPFSSSHCNDDSLTLNGVKRSSVTILAADNLVSNELCVRNCIVLPHKELTRNYANEILM